MQACGCIGSVKHQVHVPLTYWPEGKGLSHLSLGCLPSSFWSCFHMLCVSPRAARPELGPGT